MKNQERFSAVYNELASIPKLKRAAGANQAQSSSQSLYAAHDSLIVASSKKQANIKHKT